jgi:hypothetical protein
MTASGDRFGRLVVLRMFRDGHALMCCDATRLTSAGRRTRYIDREQLCLLED